MTRPWPNDQMALMARNELAAGGRLGGLRDGPYPGNSPLWDGPPPRLESSFGPDGFSIAAQVTVPEGGVPADLGRTVLVEVVASNTWGGQTQRLFNIGAGLSAMMRIGNFETVGVKVRNATGKPLAVQGFPAEGIPAGVRVFFSWTWDLFGRGPLRLFQLVPAATILPVPEGAEFVQPELACTVTWQAPQYATTYVQALPAGVQTPVAFGSAFSCNIATKFVWQLQGL